jgi:hypothetical protein
MLTPHALNVETDINGAWMICVTMNVNMTRLDVFAKPTACHAGQRQSLDVLAYVMTDSLDRDVQSPVLIDTRIVPLHGQLRIVLPVSHCTNFYVGFALPCVAYVYRLRLQQNNAPTLHYSLRNLINI